VNGQVNGEKYEAWPFSHKNVLGLPPHFTNLADPQGRVFGATMLSDSPIVSITPGKPRFRKLDAVAADQGIDSAQLEAYLLQLGELEGTSGEAFVEKMAQAAVKDLDPRFMSFDPDYAEYQRYANALMGTVAAKWKNSPMGFNPLTRYATIFSDRYEAKADVFDSVLQFWVDKNSSNTEAASNDYGPNMLEQMTKKASDLMREVNGMMGRGAQFEVNQSESSRANQMMGSGKEEAADAITSASSFGGGVGSAAKTVLGGSKLVFPEIWKDSTFGRSVSLSMKFESPYGDANSIFDYVIIPTLACLVLSLPRQDTLSGYYAPFLVSVDCPGWFSIDLGAITSLSLTRAPEGEWSNDGLPLNIQVTMDIKDLYPTLMLAKEFRIMKLNKSLHTFLDNMAGLRISSPVEIWGQRWVDRMAAMGWSSSPQGAIDQFINSVGGDKISRFIRERL